MCPSFLQTDIVYDMFAGIGKTPLQTPLQTRLLLVAHNSYMMTSWTVDSPHLELAPPTYASSQSSQGVALSPFCRSVCAPGWQKGLPGLCERLEP